MNHNNPLMAYIRPIKMATKIPSGTNYYTEKVIDFTDSGEVGIRAMTGDDEILLKNPDAILSGEAIKRVLLSCVDGLKRPELLLNNDVDAMMIAIRHATFGDKNEYNPICPKCGESTLFALNVGELLENMDLLSPTYSVKLSSGLSVNLKPYMFKDKIASLRLVFEQEKMKRALNKDSEREAILGVVSKCITTMADLSRQMMTNAIIQITGDDFNLINNEQNSAYISEYLQNIPVTDVELIDEKLNEINKIGVNNKIDVTCKHCQHQWVAELDLNPVNFSSVF